jgi:ABC-type Co2+ transport system permease subunit
LTDRGAGWVPIDQPGSTPTGREGKDHEQQKTFLLAYMALATSALVAPAAPSASGVIVDLPGGAAIGSGVDVNLQGTAEFNTLGSGVRCTQVDSTLTSESATTGKASFVATNPHTACTGLGIFNKCTVTSVTPADEFQVHVKTTDLELTNVVLKYTFANLGANTCEYASVETTFTTMIVALSSGQPAATNGLTTVTVIGTGTAHVTKNTIHGTTATTLAVSEASPTHDPATKCWDIRHRAHRHIRAVIQQSGKRCSVIAFKAAEDREEFAAVLRFCRAAA